VPEEAEVQQEMRAVIPEQVVQEAVAQERMVRAAQAVQVV
jgi:hypothetical protein